jgi:hypothetical protein
VSAIPRKLRLAVVARAGGCCEYCLLHSMGQVARFPIDHIIPRSEHGRTVLKNLALACPHCNARKWAHSHGRDLLTGKQVPLYNPRKQSWSVHFQWSAKDSYLLEGKTSCGRATVERLQMNHPDMVRIRRLLAELGFPVGVKS